jgi:hypothetical protein
MKKQYVQIDMEALGNILKDRGITKQAFSEALGYTYSWYHVLKTRNGRVTTSQLKMITMIHDIPAERILAKEPERKEENPVLYIVTMLQNIEERIAKLEKAWT